MGRSGLLRHPPQRPRRRRAAPWEAESVPAAAYYQDEWQEEEWADQPEPSAYDDGPAFAEDSSQYAALDDDDSALAAQAEADDDYPDEEGFDLPEDEQWPPEPEDDGSNEERGLVPYQPRQTGSFRRGSRALVAYNDEFFGLELGAPTPIFIAGERKTDKPGALGHTPIAPRAHRPRPFFFHTLALAIMLVSLMVSALTVGALSAGPQGWNGPTSLAGAAAPIPEVKFRWYTVHFGDTVEGIAKQFGVKPGGILLLNGLIAGEQIYTGMNLKVPADPNYGASYHALLDLPYAPAITPPPPYGSYVVPPGFYSFSVQDYPGDPYAGSFGQCTWWAAHKRPDQNFWGIGDAWTWADGARARGYTVTDYPVPNATVVFQPGVQGALGVGHVAHVEQILTGGWILISEMNFYWNDGGWGRVDYRYITAGPGVAFIH